MGDSTPFHGTGQQAQASTSEPKPTGPLDNEQPKQRGMWSAIGTDDPAARAQADWNATDPKKQLKGNQGNVLAALRANRNAPLYLAKLAALVQAGDAKTAAALAKQNTPIWQQATHDAGSVSSADSDYGRDKGNNDLLIEDVNSGRHTRDPAYEAEIFRQLPAAKLDFIAQYAMTPGASMGMASSGTFGMAVSSAEAGGGISPQTVAGKTTGVWADRKSGSGNFTASPSYDQGAVQAANAVAQQQIDAAQKGFSDAAAHIAELDRTCASELSDISPALTAAEISAYIERFRATGDYPGAIAARAAAAARLQSVMATYSTQLDVMTDAHREDTSAEQMIKNYQLLAASGGGGALQAAQWVDTKAVTQAEKVTRVTDQTYAGQTVGLERILQIIDDTIAREALARISTSMKSGTSFKQRFDAMWTAVDEGYLEPYENLKSAYGIREAKAKLGQFFKESSEYLDPLGKPTPKLKAAIEELTKEMKNLDPLTTKVTSGVRDMLGIMASVANGSIGNVDAIVADASETVEKMHELVALSRGQKIGDTPEELARLQRLSGDVAEHASGLAKLLPFVDIGASAWATLGDIKGLTNNGKDPFRYTALLGDMAATLGGALELLPPPADALGVALNLAGQAVSGISDFFIGLIEHEEDPIQKQKTEILDDIDPGQGPRNAALADPNAAVNLAAAQAAGISQGQINSLVQQVPKVFTTAGAVDPMLRVLSYLEHGALVPAQDGLKRYTLAKQEPGAYLLAVGKRLGDVSYFTRIGELDQDGTGFIPYSGIIQLFIGVAYGMTPANGQGLYPLSDYTVTLLRTNS